MTNSELGTMRSTDDANDPTARRVAYRTLIGRLRDRVPSLVPPGSRILVVSRGDEELLHLQGLQTSHFPQADDGRYAGHYPVDADAAVRHLESLRAGGAEFLVFPQPALWWLDHYEGLDRHLQEHHRQLHRDGDFALFQLGGSREATNSVDATVMARAARWRQIADLLDAILPREAPLIVVSIEAPPAEVGSRTLVHIATSVAGDDALDATGHPLVFAVRDAIRAGVRYLLVPHTPGDSTIGPALSTIRARYRLVLHHADLCTVFDTIPMRGALSLNRQGAARAEA